MKQKLIKDLQIGDVVNNSDLPISEIPYSHMTVINKTENEVKFFRPYVHLGSLVMTGGVIPYVGVETFTVPFSENSPHVFVVLGNIYRGKK